MASQALWRPSLGGATILAVPHSKFFIAAPSSMQTWSIFAPIFRQKHTLLCSQIGRASSSTLLSCNRRFGAAVAATAVETSPSVFDSADGEQALQSSELRKDADVDYQRETGNKYLIGKSEEDLVKLSMSLGEQKYRGRQIHSFVYKTKTKRIADFHHVPKSMREALVSAGWQVGRSPVHHVARSADGTIKILLRLEDNRLVETVGIPVQDKAGKITRLTACISSQVGCALKCTFCATGKGGFARNLRVNEIVEQVLVIEELFGCRVSNVVFMGMGEPLMNLPALLPALQVLNKEVLIGQRMMTISTVGVPNTITRLASYKLQSTLAISLHAPNQELRAQLVPSARAYPLVALMTDIRNYFLETGRRVSIEYTLLDGVNDKIVHAEELADLLHHWKLGMHVNVIPYNPIADSEFRRPSKARVTAFVDALNGRRVTASIRQTRGLDASAACGQLRNEFQKFPLSQNMDSKLQV